MHDKPTLTELVDKLESLGSSEHIAMFFEQQGIKADQANAFSCAVAKYVQNGTGASFATVTPQKVCTYPCNDIDPADEVSIIGSPVSHFVHDFDRGKYPELVADA